MPAQICQGCGSEIPEDARFCQNCGREITTWVCRNCQTRVPRGARFCQNCGREIASPPPVPHPIKITESAATRLSNICRKNISALKLNRLFHSVLDNWSWRKMRRSHRLALIFTAAVVLSIAIFNLAGGQGKGIVLKLEKTSSLPLMPLSINVGKMTASASMTVTFANSSGYAVNTDVIDAKEDGSIVVSVPLYVKPGTQEITRGKVKVVVTEHPADGSPGWQSAPASFIIEDLPTLKDLPPGRVTHSFFTAMALLSQQRIAVLEYFENASDGKIDTGDARSCETDLLQSIIGARQQIGSLMAAPQQSITFGSTIDGTAIKFTRQSLEIADGIIAIWLTGLPLNEDTTAASARQLSFLGAGSDTLSVIAGQFSSSLMDEPTEPSLASAGIIDIDMMDALCGKLATIIGIKQAGETLTDENTGVAEKTIALFDGLNNTADLFDVETPEALGQFVAAGVMDLAVQRCVDRATGLISQAVEINADPYNYEKPDDEAVFRNIASDYISAFAQVALCIQSIAYGGVTPGIASLSLAMFDEISGEEYTEIQQGIEKSIQENFEAVRHGCLVSGTVAETRTQSGLDMIRLSVIASGDDQAEMTALTDAEGNYELMIPRDRYGNLTSSLTITASEPLRGEIYDTAVVNLRDIDTGRPVTVPPLLVTLPETEYDTPITTTATQSTIATGTTPTVKPFRTYRGTLTVETELVQEEVFGSLSNRCTFTLPFEELPLYRIPDTEMYGYMITADTGTFTGEWSLALKQSADGVNYSAAPSSGRFSGSYTGRLWGALTNGKLAFEESLESPQGEPSTFMLTQTSVDTGYSTTATGYVGLPYNDIDKMLHKIAFGNVDTDTLEHDWPTWCSAIWQNSQINTAYPDKTSQNITFSGSYVNYAGVNITYKGNLTLELTGK